MINHSKKILQNIGIALLFIIIYAIFIISLPILIPIMIVFSLKNRYKQRKMRRKFFSDWGNSKIGILAYSTQQPEAQEIVKLVDPSLLKKLAIIKNGSSRTLDDKTTDYFTSEYGYDSGGEDFDDQEDEDKGSICLSLIFIHYDRIETVPIVLEKVLTKASIRDKAKKISFIVEAESIKKELNDAADALWECAD